MFQNKKVVAKKCKKTFLTVLPFPFYLSRLFHFSLYLKSHNIRFIVT